MKSKKTKTKKTSSNRAKVKNYPSQYLAIVLGLMLIVEGTIMGSVHMGDWQHAAGLLDVSGGVAEVVTDVATAIQPMTDVAAGVYQFYQEAATQMASLLDISGSVGGLTMFTDAVSEFYSQASSQMALLLDASNLQPWPALVSGISIQK